MVIWKNSKDFIESDKSNNKDFSIWSVFHLFNETTSETVTFDIVMIDSTCNIYECLNTDLAIYLPKTIQL